MSIPVCRCGSNCTSEQVVVTETQFDLSLEGYQVELFDSISEVPYAWEDAAPKDNIFLQRPYFELLERISLENFKFYYLVFTQDTIPVGVAALQCIQFKGSKMVNLPASSSSFVQASKDKLLKVLNFNILICGNATLTGDYAFHFDKTIPVGRRFKLTVEALQLSKKQLEARGLRIDALAYKEFYKARRIVARKLEKQHYQEFSIQPAMHLSIREDWKQFEDYLTAMSSKYRVRAKRAMKKANAIEKRILSLAEIEQHQADIYRLYRTIADAALMNVMTWPPNYFLELKRTYQNDFRLIGYFLDDQLVGFCTTIKNYQHLDAHFLGFDNEINRQHQLYLNMLYDIIRVGIEEGAKDIAMSRTALEIKSSVGAEPHDMFGYLKFSNSIFNRMAKTLFGYLEAEEKWIQRKPFKEDI